MTIRKLAFLCSSIMAAMMFASFALAQSEYILHTFISNNDGATPQAGLISDANGNLYGTTAYGGILKDCGTSSGQPVGCGTVFEMSPPVEQGQGWTETVLHEFDSIDGISPSGPLLLDSKGNLYGVTPYAGLGLQGFVYELSPSEKQGGQWKLTNIATFTQNEGSLETPSGALVMDADGNLYGTASDGGLNCGGVFELSPSGGSWTLTTLYLFGSNQNDGCHPQSGLITDGAGRLYGTTTQGSGNPYGTVFALSRSNSGTWTSHRLHAFSSEHDGASPVGSLVMSRGSLFGATSNGGDSGCGGLGCGTVYEISRSEGYKVIYRFVEGTLNGIVPASGLTADLQGNLYGTTETGGLETPCPFVGSTGCGTVYQLSAPDQGGKWNERMLYAFTGFNGDGVFPMSSVLWTRKGVLYGTTSEGGNEDCSTFETLGCGIVFSLVK